MTDFLHELDALNRLTWQKVAARADRITGKRVAMPDRIDCQRQDAESRFADNFPVLDHLDSA